MVENNNEVNVLRLVDRKLLELSGVSNVESFDEMQISLLTNLGPLIIKGQGLHITQLNLESGKVSVIGIIDELQYLEDKGEKFRNKRRGFLQRILK